MQLKTGMELLRHIAIQMELSGIPDLVRGLLSSTSVNSGSLLIHGSWSSKERNRAYFKFTITPGLLSACGLVSSASPPGWFHWCYWIRSFTLWCTHTFWSKRFRPRHRSSRPNTLPRLKLDNSLPEFFTLPTSYSKEKNVKPKAVGSDWLVCKCMDMASLHCLWHFRNGSTRKRIESSRFSSLCIAFSAN